MGTSAAQAKTLLTMDGMGFQMPSMGRPPLLNPPPQIFGAYPNEGLPMSHLPPELAAQMFPDHATLLDDANEAKRRRIARVCKPVRAPAVAAGGPSCRLRALVC